MGWKDGVQLAFRNSWNQALTLSRVPGLCFWPFFTSEDSTLRFLEKGLDWPVLGHMITMGQ